MQSNKNEHICFGNKSSLPFQDSTNLATHIYSQCFSSILWSEDQGVIWGAAIQTEGMQVEDHADTRLSSLKWHMCSHGLNMGVISQNHSMALQYEQGKASLTQYHNLDLIRKKAGLKHT